MKYGFTVTVCTGPSYGNPSFVPIAKVPPGIETIPAGADVGFVAGPAATHARSSNGITRRSDIGSVEI
jgi:hypothetical protein